MSTPMVQYYLRYLEDVTFEEIQTVTYEMYCGALDLSFNQTLNESYFHNYLDENIFGNIRKMNIARGLVRVFNELRYNIQKVGKDFMMNLNDLISAFKNREAYDMLKAFGFNFKLVFRAIGAFTNALKGGLLEVFKELARTKAFQKIRRGAIKIDEVLDKFRIQMIRIQKL